MGIAYFQPFCFLPSGCIVSQRSLGLEALITRFAERLEAVVLLFEAIPSRARILSCPCKRPF